MSYNYAFADVYDVFTVNVEYEKRAAYLLEILRRNGIEKGIMLDLACGTGSLTKHFSKSGFEMIAVDGSCDMLMIAGNKEYDNEVLFLCQDMAELDLYGTVNCTVCTLDSVNHILSPDKVGEVFRRVSLFTEPGGIFIFDVNSFYKHRTVLNGRDFVFENDDTMLIWQNSECDENGLIDITIDIFKDDGSGRYFRETEMFSERAYDNAAIISLLEKAGFSLVDIYGDMTFEKPSDTEERLIFVAKKN